MANSKEKTLALLSTTAVTSLAGVSQTTLYTVPVGVKCVLSEAWLETAADVGAALQFQIGQNGATTDFLISTAGDNLDAQFDVIICKPIISATPVKGKAYPAGTVIEFDVTVGGNAVAGTLYLFGFLVAV